MRILSTVFFSKFFGGKICHIWTEITYRTGFFKKKKAHAYFRRPYFSKFFGGKLKIFKQPLKILLNFQYQICEHLS